MVLPEVPVQPLPPPIRKPLPPPVPTLVSSPARPLLDLDGQYTKGTWQIPPAQCKKLIKQHGAKGRSADT
ncbi:hypothetical protein E2562_021863 [Oryza meyeriana var. granulata]|uniref:Uncharacterized protein n=1 Tax=Oryza meyeriana var. granulata TaxID=110450 RepID=A0A6G1C8L1_9ORYZ|nr:hypothetical protein E2562_021863 [Oryza meyeriana var. granulata]